MRIRIDNALVYHAEDRTFCQETILTENDKIGYMGQDKPACEQTINAEGLCVIPGFVDVHTHGCLGHDFSSADNDGLSAMARGYAKTGVTSVMPTLATATFEELCGAADAVCHLKNKQIGGAVFRGVHLEGRYLNPVKRGAHNESLLAPLDADDLKKLLPHLGKPCHITAALELDRDGSFTETALQYGATLSLGHTNATAEEANRLVQKGVTAFTHLYNAMSPLHHREGGAAAAGICSDAFIELICDGIHVCPMMIRLAYRAHNPDKFVLITDSMEATGMPDGHYSIGGLPVIVSDGVARTLDGALAGSTLTMPTAVKNLMDFCSIPLEEALYHATLAPAREMRIDGQVGSLAVGKSADLLLIHPHRKDKVPFATEKIMIEGTWYE